MPDGFKDFWRPAQCLGTERREKPLHGGAAVCRAEIAARHFTTFMPDHEKTRSILIACLKGGEPVVFHQHEETLLRQIGGSARIKTARAVLDGIATISRQRLSAGKRYCTQPFRRQALHRI